jgi:hypothetical protein
MNSISETPSIDLNQLARFPTRSLFARDCLFVVICAAEHPAGGGVHVMHLAAGRALHWSIGRVIVGRIIRGPALDAEVSVRTAENEGGHLS